MKPNDWERQYLDLCKDVSMNGMASDSRVGMTTRKFGQSLAIELDDGMFPLLTTRKAFYKPVFGELTAFLMGSEYNYDFLKHGCKYWTPNARKAENMKDVADEDLKVGPIYGYQWRRFNGHNAFDQLEMAQRMIASEPSSRRIMVTAWNPQQLDEMCLPPCHTHFQYHVDGDQLHCSVYMRSVDLCLGLPADITLYYALLIIMANDAGLRPGGLYFHFGDAHVYVKHVPMLQKQVYRLTGRPPIYKLLKPGKPMLDDFLPDMIQIDDYNPQEAISYELFA